jgi:hypothetical protein
MIKKIKINSQNKISLCNIQEKKYIIAFLGFKSPKYFFMPFKAYGIVQNNYLYLANFHLENKMLFNGFFRTLAIISREKEFFYKKQLRLRGVGFKMQYDSANTNLELKLGYSHFNNIFIPTKILGIKIKKRKLILESLNKAFLGNFINKIIHLKYPDVYKSKGFLLKYKNLRLKTIKKK